ncbi:amino acid ABC transporter permease [Aeromonas rivipollensis]|uniref:amino acid ABC transporter permease n=1 Tax=Aeromonas rivipollensis TaxID=948519 RepID=UPI0013D524EA|nr:amino acid ABC transporter permease [Aeromonas rivipollensis]NEX80478.1 amino acid ABC transporter permease [Aeromonas rivipollensis]
MFVNELQEALPPPNHRRGLVAWIRQNLFPNWWNGLLTLVLAYLLLPLLWSALDWAIFSANWQGSSRADCTQGGACWVFIESRLGQYLYGFYPVDQYWRINLAFAGLAVLLALLIWPHTPRKGWLALFTLLVFPVIAFVLIHGGAGLEVVETNRWGGLMLTLVLAVVGIVVALPFGILLALGRRSHMPVISSLSTVYIEFWRAVPLITVLFMASVMLPLFMTSEVELDKLLRALIGIILFQAAYVAEVVRGGLQAIPKGQYEAGEALGLSYWKVMGLVIMPQALKITIPSLVNTFISLFKDTSLVLIIGLFDLLAISKVALADPAWLGFSTEAYVFIAMIFWMFCFGMSRYSIYLERKLNTGHKH